MYGKQEDQNIFSLIIQFVQFVWFGIKATWFCNIISYAFIMNYLS